MPNTLSTSNLTLLEAYEDFKAKNPKTRIREAACQLNVSEAELLATGIGKDTIRLDGPWDELLSDFKSLGHVMSLTRNEACVLEHKGSFEKVNTFGRGGHHMGTVIGPIETRVFFKNWAFAFAHQMDKGGKSMHSIQVFDRAGTAITKIYLQADADFEAYEKLVEKYKMENQSSYLDIQDIPTVEYAKEIDQEAFLADWAALEDTHDFFPMLRKYKAHREHAVQLAEGKFTRRISNDAVNTILEKASAEQLPIMIFAGNHGNLQIHQDVVNRIVPLDRGDQQWINVMDPNFNLHLRTDMIANAYAVEKPTKDGIVTSVELFDQGGEMIAQFFGLRKPGQTELTEWKELVSTLN
mgnify:CR=1 FL=1